MISIKCLSATSLLLEHLLGNLSIFIDWYTPLNRFKRQLDAVVAQFGEKVSGLKPRRHLVEAFLRKKNNWSRWRRAAEVETETDQESVCVNVCVCVWERERERERENLKMPFMLNRFLGSWNVANGCNYFSQQHQLMADFYLRQKTGAVGLLPRRPPIAESCTASVKGNCWTTWEQYESSSTTTLNVLN